VENQNTAFSIPDPPVISLDQAYEEIVPNNTVQFRGKYPQNYINFEIEDITDIKVAGITAHDGAPLTFPFIINFAEPNGPSDYWTSQQFYDRLQQARTDNNPYFSRDRVSVIYVDFNVLSQYFKKEEFNCGERYAEVEIIKTIGRPEIEQDIKLEMIRHIQWMISSEENLRPVNASEPSGFGGWNINTTPILGRQHQECIKQQQVGDSLDGFNPEGFEIIDPRGVLTQEFSFDFDNSIFGPDGRGRSNQDYDGSPRGDTNVDLREDGASGPREDTRSNTDFDGSPRGDTNVTVLDTSGDTRSSTDYTIGDAPRGDSTADTRDYTNTEPLDVRSPSVGAGTYYPFTTAGSYIGETKIYNRRTYVWDGAQWINI
jgi:hypothetical protein